MDMGCHAFEFFFRWLPGQGRPDERERRRGFGGLCKRQSTRRRWARSCPWLAAEGRCRCTRRWARSSINEEDPGGTTTAVINRALSRRTTARWVRSGRRRAGRRRGGMDDTAEVHGFPPASPMRICCRAIPSSRNSDTGYSYGGGKEGRPERAAGVSPRSRNCGIMVFPPGVPPISSTCVGARNRQPLVHRGRTGGPVLEIVLAAYASRRERGRKVGACPFARRRSGPNRVVESLGVGPAGAQQDNDPAAGPRHFTCSGASTYFQGVIQGRRAYRRRGFRRKISRNTDDLSQPRFASSRRRSPPGVCRKISKLRLGRRERRMEPVFGDARGPHTRS